MTPFDLCISMGDPCGISFEVLFNWLNQLDDSTIETYFKKTDVHLKLFGSAEVLERLIKQYNQALKIKNNHLMPNNESIALELFDVPYKNIERFSVGRLSSEGGENALNTLKSVCTHIKEDTSRVLVTLPLTKESIINIDPDFMGHTEYLANFFDTPVMMCFFSPLFNLSLITTHIALSDVPKYINNEVFIKNKIVMSYQFKQQTNSTKPLLVLGLNPHAGEGGKIGREDLVLKKVINEVIEDLDLKQGDIVGPLASDSAFGDVLNKQYDHVLACYHDQGLIPLKMLSKGTSVNYTYGLPFIRTSVDHGTAYDIAGSMSADPSSFNTAVLKAIELKHSPSL